MALTSEQLHAELLAIENNGILDHFHAAADYYKLPLTRCLAIGSRETHLQNILGDGGHGHGIMQIDDRSYEQWCQSGAWRDAKQAVMKGCAVYGAKIATIANSQGKRLTIRGASFNCPSIPEETVAEIAISAYNCGEGNALLGHCIHSNSDYFTAHSTDYPEGVGGNYKADVLYRAGLFTTLLAAMENGNG